jgi:hypothetical protein
MPPGSTSWPFIARQNASSRAKRHVLAAFSVSTVAAFEPRGRNAPVEQSLAFFGVRVQHKLIESLHILVCLLTNRLAGTRQPATGAPGDAPQMDHCLGNSRITCYWTFASPHRQSHRYSKVEVVAEGALLSKKETRALDKNSGIDGRRIDIR